MQPYIINFNNCKITWYGVLFFAGYLLSGFLACRFAKRNKLSTSPMDIVLTGCFSVFGILIGAKAIYLFSILPQIFADTDAFFDLTFFEKVNYLFSGMVFYGGLIGGVLTVIIFSKVYKLPLEEIFRILVPYYPLIHAFGRVGCFMSGCCYGIEYHGLFSVVAAYGTGAGVERFPVQLLEALFNIIIFTALILIRKYTGKNGYALLDFYLIIYGTGRFFIEFLRGDTIRGVYFGLSTSQIISIVLVTAALVNYVIMEKSRYGAENLKIIGEKK